MSRLAARKALIAIVLLVVSASAGLALAAPLPRPRVAIIVGPAGEKITPLYLDLAELAAEEAERHGAVVARAYSPAATPAAVIEAVEDANIVVYFGHGTGFPNPYSRVPNPNTVNGWGLQGPTATGSHADDPVAGSMRYFGEAWLEANLRPAPGFVMIYSNACYAPGASEGGLPRPDEAEALAHVANYSRPILEMGASAYFATDFYGGAATLLRSLLAPEPRTAAAIFRSEPHFEEAALTRHPHPAIVGAQVWLHRSPYFDGAMDYWYAFAGRPGAVMASWRAASVSRTAQPGVITGQASSYAWTAGYQDQATVALPLGLTGPPDVSGRRLVAVCADRCAVMRVVDSCDCYWGTAAERVVNLSHAAWHLVSDAPLAEGLVDVRLYLDGHLPAGEAATPIVLRTAASPPGSDPADRPTVSTAHRRYGVVLP